MTVKKTPAAPEHDLDTFNKAEAFFVRDPQVVEAELFSARFKLDTSFQRRYPDLRLTAVVAENGSELIRDTTGNVDIAALHNFTMGRHVREIFKLAWLISILSWKAVESFPPWSEPYEVHFGWTLLRISVGWPRPAVTPDSE